MNIGCHYLRTFCNSVCWSTHLFQWRRSITSTRRFFHIRESTLTEDTEVGFGSQEKESNRKPEMINIYELRNLCSVPYFVKELLLLLLLLLLFHWLLTPGRDLTPLFL